MPAHTDAVAAKGVIMALLAKQSWGKLKPTALMQPAGRAITVLGPSTLRAWRTARLPPQPAQALCPKKSSLSLMVRALTAMAYLPSPSTPKKLTLGSSSMPSIVSSRP